MHKLATDFFGNKKFSPAFWTWSQSVTSDIGTNTTTSLVETVLFFKAIHIYKLDIDSWSSKFDVVTGITKQLSEQQ